MLVLILSITSAYSGGRKSMGIGNFKSNDSRDVVITKLINQECESVTSDQTNNGNDYLITAKKYSYTYRKGFLNHPRLYGTIAVKFVKNKRNGSYYMSGIVFAISDTKKLDKYLDYLNEKYFPNIDSDVTWRSKYLTISKSKNAIFTYQPIL